MDADQRRRQRNRLAAPANLDPARTPRVSAGQIVDDNGDSPSPGHVAELLRPLELVTADVDRVARRVVDPRHRDHVGRAVRADRGDPSELLPARQVFKLGFREDAHDADRRRGCSTQDTVHAPLDAAVWEQSIAESHGNPLAQLELSRTWSTADLAGGLRSAGRVRPSSARSNAAAAPTSAELPAETQLLPLAAVAEWPIRCCSTAPPRSSASR